MFEHGGDGGQVAPVVDLVSALVAEDCGRFEHQPAGAGLGGDLDEGDERFDELVPSRLDLLGAPARVCVEVVLDGYDDGVVERSLGGDVVVEGPLGDAGELGDMVQIRSRVAVGLKALTRC